MLIENTRKIRAKLLVFHMKNGRLEIESHPRRTQPEPIRNAGLKMTSSPAEYTIYTKPACPNCDKTKAYFESKGITYQAVDITEVPAALEYITQELGYSQAPVVVNNSDDEDHWAGLRRDKLVQAAMHHKAA